MMRGPTAYGELWGKKKHDSDVEKLANFLENSTIKIKIKPKKSRRGIDNEIRK